MKRKMKIQYNFRSERSLAENRRRYYLIFTKNKKVCIGGSKGGARDEPPQGPNSFIFMQFSAKNCKIIPIWELAHPPRKNPGPATANRSTCNKRSIPSFDHSKHHSKKFYSTSERLARTKLYSLNFIAIIVKRSD